MKTKSTFFAIVLSSLLFIGMNRILEAQVPEQERIALETLYDSTGGPNWYYNTNWKSGDVSGWYGVIVTGGHVTELRLSSNNLNGTIPTSFGDLTKLQHILFSQNQLNGPIPTSIENLTDLVRMDLSENQLSGSIPSTIGMLSKLETLNLYSNQIEGSIPTEIGGLTSLKYLDFDTNFLEGPIPSTIGDMTMLEELYLGGNQLSGSIPSEFGNLKNVFGFSVAFNQLSGPIPESIGDMNNLEYLLLFNNQIEGPIPPSIGELTKLFKFWAHNNQIGGEIPIEIGSMTKLEQLNLSNNQLTGPIPSAIGSLSSLRNLELNRNQLNGSLPVEICELANLEMMNLLSNQLDGSIPDSIHHLSNLTHLYLNNNQLAGIIPEKICNLSKLRVLNIDGNQMQGTIPAEIRNLTELFSLNVGRNQFIDPMPESIGDLKKLTYLIMYDNQFTSLPDLSDIIPPLTMLDVRGNKLCFDDLEPYVNTELTQFSYSPQAQIGEEKDTTISPGSSITLSVSVGGNENNYQWTKNGTVIEGAQESTFTIENAQSSDAGQYGCLITNSLLPDLELSAGLTFIEVGTTGLNPESISSLPDGFALHQNFPNPFNPVTTIRYQVGEVRVNNHSPQQVETHNYASLQDVELTVHNILGQKIANLVSKKQLPGSYTVKWDATGYSNGIYFCKLTARNLRQKTVSQTRKMILMK